MLQVQHKFSQIKSVSEEMENSLKFPPPLLFQILMFMAKRRK